jgi:cytochrome c oxidase subunit 2
MGVVKKSARLAAMGLALLTGTVSAEYGLNLPEPVSPVTRDIFDLHMLTAWVALIIMVIITAIIVYALVKFRKSAGYEADQNFEMTWFGKWAWILVPVVVLGIDMSIAGKAAKTFDLVEDTTKPDLTLKVTGSQWKWTYDYMEDDITLVSNLNRDVGVDSKTYLREVDVQVVLPVDTRIRFLHTAKDVLHAWWVPALAYKKDSIPGYINETWAIIEKEGVYRGQCAENCGTGHAYMPIVIHAVSKDKYANWVAEQKAEKAKAMADATAEKEWTLAELTERGEKVYATNCAACHQASGEGMPAAGFPALKGSQIATKDMAAHLDIVIHGSKKNPVMAAWGNMLNDLELAAVITYERNAWGNDTGELVQPADVKSAR